MKGGAECRNRHRTPLTLGSCSLRRWARWAFFLLLRLILVLTLTRSPSPEQVFARPLLRGPNTSGDRQATPPPWCWAYERPGIVLVVVGKVAAWRSETATGYETRSAPSFFGAYPHHRLRSAVADELRS